MPEVPRSRPPTTVERAERDAHTIEKRYEKQLIQDELEINFLDFKGRVRVHRALVITSPPRAAELARHLMEAGLLPTDTIEVRELRRDGVVRWRFQCGLFERKVNEALERERGEGTRAIVRRVPSPRVGVTNNG
jgi:hypothetical protein